MYLISNATRSNVITSLWWEYGFSSNVFHRVRRAAYCFAVAVKNSFQLCVINECHYEFYRQRNKIQKHANLHFTISLYKDTEVNCLFIVFKEPIQVLTNYRNGKQSGRTW